ncbi:MAG TPA: hypothetical protein DIW07_02190 [Lachnospiraceae bacterium]|uniref:hypothetical protein n=1 Tax=Muricomes intestini TaxID=1796634 RepID=UPI000EE818B5|nr:hypothetical protein [Lachnospiraceae bacterium]
MVIKCEDCGETYRAYPSFVIKGTTLTLSALIFIAFVYEYSGLVWRDIPEQFCCKHDMIAHSTIYKAVHGLGKSIADSDNKIRDAVQNLYDRYLKESNIELLAAPWPLEKSLYEHTRKREVAIRFLLSSFLIAFYSSRLDFLQLFYLYVRSYRLVLSNTDPPVCNIYKK